MTLATEDKVIKRELDLIEASNEEQRLGAILGLRISDREVLEIGRQVYALKWGSDNWAVCMVALIAGDTCSRYVKVNKSSLLAFRSYETRDEARFARDRLAVGIASDPLQEVFAGVYFETGKEVLSFRPGDFEVQFTVPAALRTFGRKGETKASARPKAQGRKAERGGQDAFRRT